MQYTNNVNGKSKGPKNMMNNYNPYQAQMAQFQAMQNQQRLAQYEQPQTQQQPQNKIMMVANEDVAKNTPINFDGSTTYFVYGDTILARSWNFPEGRVDNKVFKLQDAELPREPKQLDIIQQMLEDISGRLPQATAKKEVKDAE